MILSNKEETTFDALFHSVGCVCVYKGSFLIIKRTNSKSYPFMWGIPTGKMEQGENIGKAIIRELFEETGILQSIENFRHIDTFCIENGDMKFKYSIFTLELKYLPNIKLNSNEHVDYRWIQFKEIDNFKLIPDVKETVEIALNKKTWKQLSLFPELENDNEFLEMFKKEEKVHYPITRELFKDNYKEDKVWYAAIGAPGVGKTTILQKIEEYNPIFQCQKFNVLDQTLNFKFYLDRLFIHLEHKFFFNFQIEILQSRFWQSLLAKDHSIVDETIYSILAYTKALFSLNWIDEHTFESFFKDYCSYKAILPEPRIIFYFYCSTEVLIERIKKRKREHEKYYSYTYINQLNTDFQEIAYLLKREKQCDVIFINTANQSADEIAQLICQKYLEPTI